MRALTIRPRMAGSLSLTDISEPDPSEGPVLVETLAVGLCGTDTDIVRGAYGQAPPGEDRLVIGHENLGRVLEDQSGTYATGDLVVGVVRRPDPVPCPACAAGEWDMCLNGRYTEHGIVGLHGFARERWRATPDAMVKLPPDLDDLGVLIEPTTIVAKAWEQIERIGQRAYFHPETVAILGAGPIGLLGAMLGAQRGLDVHVFDVVNSGPKPTLVAGLGARYHDEPLGKSGLEPDIVLECTGVAQVIVDALNHNGVNGIVCLAGVSMVGALMSADVGALNRTTVLQNDVVFGTVNANRRHYQAAAMALAAADRSWLRRLITRRVRLEEFADGFARRPDDVKVTLALADRTNV
jgi:threonine dehydrogenase-like Zn-dependent dehydrogenase